jgi:hypothetical protein
VLRASRDSRWDAELTSNPWFGGREWGMAKPPMAPYLTTTLGKKCCSLCRMVFTKDMKPSLSKAFAEHIRTKHRSP